MSGATTPIVNVPSNALIQGVTQLIPICPFMHDVKVRNCNWTQVLTVLPSGDIDILAQSGVSDSLEDLEPSQYFDGVGGQREAVAPADIMRESRGKEGKGPQLGISQGPHHTRLQVLIMTRASRFI